MGYRYAILGSGMQGTAAAYDLGLHGEADSLLLCDRDSSVAGQAAARVNRLLGRRVASGAALDVETPGALESALEGVHGVFSGLPYALNPEAARAAVSARASFCDLGGNTAVVRRILALDSLAQAKGVSVVPDCGLAPGLGNVLAATAMSRLRHAQHVHIRCGGLPVRPQPPLGYQLVFHIGGLTNEYMGEAECLRDGELHRVPTLEELETLNFSDPVGACEAFTTSGGTSTCCETFLGNLRTYDYKTVRYPGHCEKIRLLRDLGLLDLSPVIVRGTSVVPREVFHACAAPKLSFPGERDLVVLRVSAFGSEGSEQIVFDLYDVHDEKTGFTAMERTTAFPAAATLYLQVRGEIRSGAATPERAVPGERLLEFVRARGLRIVERSSSESAR